ncbi:MAG: iron-containing redox enzyme family protein [Thaumarchaeota archaeon]|nr:iron-containing redox enzyme family protein [Nitrososphaerota archaeon]
MARCPACERAYGSYEGLSTHFSEEAARSDASHIMWLNRNITKDKGRGKELGSLLFEFFDTGKTGLRVWVKQRFIERFFGLKPHPFVLALQHPAKAVLIGYVLEHQHFLRQWVRSLSWVLAKTDRADVVKEELDNIVTEFYGYGDDRPSHYELLIRMGQSLGLSRETVLGTPPLPATVSAIQTWQAIGRDKHWLETMAAMHSLELIANRDVKQDGAKITYFDPQILQNDEITPETKAFLHEGYEADVEHSEVPLEMVERYAKEFGLVEDVQITFLKSVEAFDSYLMARLERGMQFDGRLVAYAGGRAA